MMLKLVAFITTALCLILACPRLLAQDGYKYSASFKIPKGDELPPASVTSHPTENKYYVSGPWQIYEYSSVTFELLRVFGKPEPGQQIGEFRTAVGIGVIGKQLYVADTLNNRVQIIDLQTGLFVGAWGGTGNVTKSIPIF